MHDAQLVQRLHLDHSITGTPGAVERPLEIIGGVVSGAGAHPAALQQQVAQRGVAIGLETQLGGGFERARIVRERRLDRVNAPSGAGGDRVVAVRPRGVARFEKW